MVNTCLLLSSNTARVTVPTLLPLVEAVPRIFSGNVQILDNEWRNLDTIELPDEIKAHQCGIVEFYQKLAELKEDDEYIFKNLATFALQILSLPISNTDAERLFSKLNLIKTDARNKLSTESVHALTVISEAVREHECCYKFKPSQTMVASV